MRHGSHLEMVRASSRASRHLPCSASCPPSRSTERTRPEFSGCVPRRRSTGATTYEADPAKALGAAVRALRMEHGIAQEDLANLAGIERSHLGKIERGTQMPTLALILKIARALGCSAADLMAETKSRLSASVS